MSPEGRLEILLGELEKFIAEELFAIEQENWDYLQELLKKKEGHLTEILKLKTQASFSVAQFGSLVQKVQQGEQIARELLARKIEAVKSARAEIDATKVRIGRIRELAKMQGGSSYSGMSGKFRADA